MTSIPQNFRNLITPGNGDVVGPTLGANAWVIPLSVTPVAGRLLIVFTGSANGVTPSIQSSGWTLLAAPQELPIVDGGIFMAAAKVATGSETTFEFTGRFQGSARIIEAQAYTLAGGSPIVSSLVESPTTKLGVSPTPNVSYGSNANVRMDLVHAFEAPSFQPAPTDTTGMNYIDGWGNQAQYGPGVFYASMLTGNPDSGRAWVPYTGSISFVIGLHLTAWVVGAQGFG